MHSDDVLREKLIEIMALLRSMAWKFCSDEDIVDGAVQLATLAWYTAIEQGVQIESESAWLRGVLRKKVADLCNARGYSVVPVEFDPEMLGQLPDARVGGNQPCAKQRRVLQRAVAGLEEEDRNICWLYYFVGYNRKRVAETLGITVDTVYKRLQRVIPKLREMVGSELRLDDDVNGSSDEEEEEARN